MRHTLAVLFVVGTLCACGDDSSTPGDAGPPPGTDAGPGSDASFPDPIEDMVTITRGLYGRSLTVDDTGGGSSGVTTPLSITSGGVEVANTGDRPSAFYEVALDPGTYQICTDFGTCSPDVTITDGLVRCDFEAGPGGGFWTCQDERPAG